MALKRQKLPTWRWIETETDGIRTIRLAAKECTIDIFPRPGYCDRGRWQAYVLDEGFPENPSPFDFADGFPRYYFDLERAKAEMEDLMDARGYTPKID